VNIRNFGWAAALLWSATALARPDAQNSTDIVKYAANDVVETFNSLGGNFKIHYTRMGANSVPPDDLDMSGVPDHVEKVAALYEQVLAFYLKLGFRAPPADGTAGGDARFDVYLLDYAGKADGSFVREKCTGDTCSGYMMQENDFAGYNYPSLDYADRVLCSHEFFHAVQAGYDANQSSIVSEGTAVWATEKFDNTLNDFEEFTPGFMTRVDHSIDVPGPGPVDPFSYGSAIFFEFLDEHVGGDVIRELWEDCANGAQGVSDPTWYPALQALLARSHGTSMPAEFLTFATWNLYTGARADAKRSYARGSGYALAKMTLGTLPYRDDTLRVYESSAQYVKVDPAGRGQIGVYVKSAMDLAPMKVGLATRTGNKVSDLFPVAPAESGTLQTIAATGVDEVIVMVVNTAVTGESLRGSLCIGSPVPAAAGAGHDLRRRR
jgi:hypothetical protein